MVTQRIVIDPVTRIEGHSKVTILVGEDGQITDARFHVTQHRCGRNGSELDNRVHVLEYKQRLARCNGEGIYSRGSLERHLHESA